MNAQKPIKLYAIAGEASGDMHAANLLKALRSKKSDIEIRCWGGELMEKEGAVLVKHYRDLAFMGFLEVLFNLRTILRNLAFCKKDISEFQPDALLLIDYPGFNLRIAEWAHKKGIKIIYYVSPQIWAWKQSRVHKIKRIVDKMLVILPFEEQFYANFNYKAHYVGHPLLDAIEQYNQTLAPSSNEFRKKWNLAAQKQIVALLPGSRKQEIEVMLPYMLKLAAKYNAYEFVIAAAPSQTEAFYKSILAKNAHQVKIIHGDTYGLYANSFAALVTSGTATLEAALFEIPQVVCYKGNWLTYFIARSLVKVKYISLVNLIMDAPVITELIQQDLNAKFLEREFKKLLDPKYRNQLAGKYQELKSLLGNAGASENAANELLKTLKVL